MPEGVCHSFKNEARAASTPPPPTTHPVTPQSKSKQRSGGDARKEATHYTRVKGSSACGCPWYNSRYNSSPAKETRGQKEAKHQGQKKKTLANKNDRGKPLTLRPGPSLTRNWHHQPVEMAAHIHLLSTSCLSSHAAGGGDMSCSNCSAGDACNPALQVSSFGNHTPASLMNGSKALVKTNETR